MRILYDSKNLIYKSPFGCVFEGEVCKMRIDIPTSCNTCEVFVLLNSDHIGEELKIPFVHKETLGDYDIFVCEFFLKQAGLYFYKFFVRTVSSSFELYKEGSCNTNIWIGDLWQISCLPKDFSVPESFQGRVMYQIFPDRFFKSGNCDLAGKLEPFFVHDNINDIPHYAPDENGRVLNCDFYGGNLKGIEKKLPYIKNLGVSIIYLNPIFKAYSNHRYDTCDYKTIDPMLGTESDFAELCSTAHELDIKIILDGVFSHTGSNSIYFDKNKIFGNGAVSNLQSPYKNWYKFSDYPNKYDSWWGIDTLPCVNEVDDGYLDYIIRNDDSVIAHWLNLGADGFRLDVADELPDEFIYLLRKKVKEIKPESFVVGEVWEDASNKISYGMRRRYFIGAELDSVMNYVFKDAIINFVTEKITAEDFADKIMTVSENYPRDSLNSLMNSLSTHDTARILTCLSGIEFPDTKSVQASRVLNKKEYVIAVSRLYTAALLQYTLPGTPCIYYGDEIGMQGFGDPFCRGYFRWDDIDYDILTLFRELGKIKNKYKSLQLGSVKVNAKDGVLTIARNYNNETVFSVVNMGDSMYGISCKNIILSHCVSIVNDKTYINKGGYVMYAVN